MLKITDEIRKDLKGHGILSNRDGEHFSIRVITENGVMSGEQMAVLAKVAKEFGNGNMSFTSRMTVELMGFPYENLEGARKAIEAGGMETGGTGAKVRPVAACKGTVCVFGLIDTHAMAKEVHDRFYTGYGSVKLPHKFKIAVGGCPNNCVKPDLNDVGIVGQRVPSLNGEKCKKCKKCGVELGCPMKAAVAGGGAPEIDREKCSQCGLCVKRCYFGAMESAQDGYKIYVGGRWGKFTRHGTPLPKVFDHDEALQMVEKCILFFKEYGETGERFSTVIDRMGVEKSIEILLGDSLLEKKEAILAK